MYSQVPHRHCSSLDSTDKCAVALIYGELLEKERKSHRMQFCFYPFHPPYHLKFHHCKMAFLRNTAYDTRNHDPVSHSAPHPQLLDRVCINPSTAMYVQTVSIYDPVSSASAIFVRRDREPMKDEHEPIHLLSHKRSSDDDDRVRI